VVVRGEGGADRVGPRRRDTSTCARERPVALTDGARGTERGWGARMRGIGADRSAPPGRGREGVWTRGRELAPTARPGCQGGVGARGGLAGLD
jgi:hypothetical protein